MLDGDTKVHTLDYGDRSFEWLRENEKLSFRVFVRDESGNMKVETARLVWTKAPARLSGFACDDYEIFGTLGQEILALHNQPKTLDELHAGDIVFPIKRVREAFYRDSYPDQEVYTLKFKNAEKLYFQLIGGHLAKSEGTDTSQPR